MIFKNDSSDQEKEVVVAVCRLLWVIGGKKGKVAHLIAFLNYSHCSIPFFKVLGAFKKKRPSGVGEQCGGGRERWMHIILMSLHSGCYVYKCRFEWLTQLFSLRA